MVITVGIVLVGPYRVFSMGLLAMEVVLDQEEKYLRVFQEFFFCIYKMEYWSRECPKCELVAQVELACVSHQLRTLEVCCYYVGDGLFSREYSQC